MRMFFMLLAHIYHFTEPTQSPEQLRGGLWCSFGQAPGHSKGFDMLSAGFSMPMIWSDLRLAKDAVGCWLCLVACCEQAVWNSWNIYIFIWKTRSKMAFRK